MMIYKTIYVNGVECFLILETEQTPYKAELYKRENGEIKYISQNHFLSLQEISVHLRGWILSAVNKFNKETVFQAIEEWDGVIE